MKHSIGHTRNGIPVYVELISSMAGRHIAQQPSLLGLIKEALRDTKASGAKLNVECDMGRPVGYNYVVETTEKDTIVYACLMHDDVYTRFVKNGKPLATQYLTMTLYRDTHGHYELKDAWVGRNTPPRPGTPNESAESKPYWENHAFVLDNQAVQTRTVTKVCPY
ncbi:MAG TPA: hypothetical protein VLF43_03405 [Candidatus Saccharimonadales bacterium]|nr:hypothetical protein [Candidatus Saccharimonadales bacterium]